MSKRDQRQKMGISPLSNNQNVTLEDAGNTIYGLDTGDKNLGLSLSKDGSYKFKSFLLESTGVQIPENVSIDDYRALGEILVKLAGSIQWLIADYALYAKPQTEYGKTYEDLMIKYNLSYSTVAKYKETAERIPFFRRRKNLSWSHHTTIAQADLTDPQRWALLEECESADWSVRTLREEIAKVQGKTPPLPTTPLERVQLSSEKLLSKAEEKAKKSEDRVGWVSHARDMARRWLELANELESE